MSSPEYRLYLLVDYISVMLSNLLTSHINQTLIKMPCFTFRSSLSDYWYWQVEVWVTFLTFFSATTTPTHLYSSADLIGSYNEPHSARLSSSDDVQLNSGTLLPDTEQRNNKHKLYKDVSTGPLSANILTHSNSSSGRKDRKNFIITSKEKGTTKLHIYWTVELLCKATRFGHQLSFRITQFGEMFHM